MSHQAREIQRSVLGSQLREHFTVPHLIAKVYLNPSLGWTCWFRPQLNIQWNAGFGENAIVQKSKANSRVTFHVAAN